MPPPARAGPDPGPAAQCHMASDLPVDPRDLFLARDLEETRARQYLATRGFRDPAGADERLQQLADDLQTRLALGELADLLLETLLEAPDPDAALTGFCRYAAKRVPKSSFIGYLQDDPRALQILTRVVGASPLLGEILIRNPEYLHWLQGELDCPPPDQVDYRAEVDALLAQDRTAPRRLDSLKRFQRREILRIAGRDLLDKDTLRSTTEQLSDLAAVVIAGALQMARRDLAASAGGAPHGSFVVIGLGRLGGRELGYSQDIDLLYVYEPEDPDDESVQARFQRLGQGLTAILAEPTEEGYCYRVDLGLQPPGPLGNAACSLQEGTRHCEGLGETFERFALIGARPIAGDLELGRRFVDGIGPFVYRADVDHAAVRALARERAGADRHGARPHPGGPGATAGGRPHGWDLIAATSRSAVREIELAAQVLQFVHGAHYPDLRDANTLSALAAAHGRDLLAEAALEDLRRAYTFLRTVEHRLQIAGAADRPGPTDRAAPETTPRRLGFETAAELETTLARHRDRVHEIYRDLLERLGRDG